MKLRSGSNILLVVLLRASRIAICSVIHTVGNYEDAGKECVQEEVIWFLSQFGSSVLNNPQQMPQAACGLT
jgi:hypothetical protein